MVLWLLVLQSVLVGIALPDVKSEFCLVMLAAELLDQPVLLRHWCGVALIIGGIVILGRRCNGPDMGIIPALLLPQLRN